VIYFLSIDVWIKLLYKLLKRWDKFLQNLYYVKLKNPIMLYYFNIQHYTRRGKIGTVKSNFSSLWREQWKGNLADE